jgi:hypothetical protein
VLIGVTFPVSVPSMETFAPEGNDVTFNEPLPFCEPAVPGSSRSPTANAPSQRTLLGWIIVVLPESFATVYL